MANFRRTNRNTAWLWVGAAILLVLVFYLVRNATRTRVPVRIATAMRRQLESTTATNGKVEQEPIFTLGMVCESPKTVIGSQALNKRWWSVC